jgi:hypothetical protein
MATYFVAIHDPIASLFHIPRDTASHSAHNRELHSEAMNL